MVSRVRTTAVIAGVLVLGLSACADRRPLTAPAPLSLPRLEKITALPIRVSRLGGLPPVVGHTQQYRVAPKDTLLDVARNAGLGFREIKDANSDVDEWIPPPGRLVTVPTRWILPRAPQQGIVVNIPEMRLYLFPTHTRPDEVVTMRTGAVAIGDDDTPSPVGPFTVVAKDKDPTWYVPASIYRTMEHRRHVVPPGPDNPMGEYRIRLSKGTYSIHGTDTPWAIGRETTHGCIRLYPEDIGELYDLIKPAMRGEMVYQPVKLGEADGRLYLEVHEDVYRRVGNLEREAFRIVRAAHVEARVDRARLRAAARERSGIPVDVTRNPTALQ